MKRRDEVLDKEFDKRKQYYIDLVTKRRARSSQFRAKRMCPDESTVTTDEDDDEDDYEDVDEGVSSDNKAERVFDKLDLTKTDACHRCQGEHKFDWLFYLLVIYSNIGYL